MSVASDLEKVLPEILRSMGVRALGADRQVQISQATGTLTVRLALPTLEVAVQIEMDDIARVRSEHAIEHVLDLLERGKRVLFRSVIDHIAEHDRSPIDRMKQIESAAANLLTVLADNFRDVVATYGATSKITTAAMRLQTLIESKPGAPSWHPNGYGPDPETAKEHT